MLGERFIAEGELARGGRFSKLGRAGTSVRMRLILLSSSSRHWSSTTLNSLSFSAELIHTLLLGQSLATLLSSSLHKYCMRGAQAELRDRNMEHIQADLWEWSKDAPVALI